MMKRQRWIIGIAIIVSLAVVLGAAVMMFWWGEEVVSSDMVEGKIYFDDNLSKGGTYSLGEAHTDPVNNEIRVLPCPDRTNGMDRQCFLFTCHDENDGIFDRNHATYTMTVWDASGREYKTSYSRDRTGTKTIELHFTPRQAGEGGFRLTATNIRWVPGWVSK